MRARGYKPFGTNLEQDTLLDRIINQAKPGTVGVFDLDGCVWYPEMYMLWGGGAPFETQPNGDLRDKAGQKCYLMGVFVPDGA